MRQFTIKELSEVELKQIIFEAVKYYFEKHPLPSFSTYESDELLTMKQARELIGISQPTLKKLVNSDKLRCYYLGRSLRIKKSDIIKSLTAVRTQINNKVILGNST